MPSYNAKSILFKEPPRGNKVGEFSYLFPNPGSNSKSTEDYDKSFDIVMESQDIKLVWKIKRKNSQIVVPDILIDTSFETIMLEKCEPDIGVKMKLLLNTHTILEEVLYAASLPYIKNDINIIRLKDAQLLMNVEVFRQNECLKRKLRNYTKILQNEKFYNVTFAVQNEKFAAHMEILSAESLVFEKMFESDMIEKNHGIVKINDIEPAVFKNFLKYIYHGKFEYDDVDSWLKLLVIADKYSVLNLVSICSKRLSDKLTSNCVVDVLVIADLVKANVLKKNCMYFIFEHKDEVVNMDCYKDLVKSHPELLSELFCEMKYINFK